MLLLFVIIKLHSVMLALQTNKQTRYKGIVCLQEVRNVNNIQISLGRG